ncbi:MAG: DUF4845 domain-containing protein [Pseudomonadota bacterium]|nr:DUF4845 domain-containing protein [Pseudomonadota bacterium]
MSRFRNSQATRGMRGSSSFSILCVIVTAWVALTALLRVLPVFMEHRTIVSAMESVASGYVPGQDQSADVREALRKAWSINRISQVDASEVSIDRRRTGVILTLEYQTGFPLVGPIQGVWDFGTVEVDGR